jgi:hypothetical protein
MAIERRIKLTCDAPACAGETGWVRPGQEMALYASARQNGWMLTADGRSVCPLHRGRR